MVDMTTIIAPKSKEKMKLPIGRIVAWFFMILLLFITIFPFYWMLRTALTPQRIIFTNTTSLLPQAVSLDNFKRVLGFFSVADAVKAGGSGQTIDFGRALFNSIVTSLIVALGQTFFSSMAAFAFARLKFPFRNQIFFIYITALMIPGVVTLIPNFILMNELGWLNSFQGIVAPFVLMSPFAVFFMRQFYIGINRDLEDCAMIDGANWFTVYFRIIMPITSAAMVTLTLVTFIGFMNEYLWPLLVARSAETRTITVAMSIFRAQRPQGGEDWGGLMAGYSLAVVPPLLLLILFGKKIVDSIRFTGIK
jgi:multiple sugar transport system permease protein